MTLSLIIFTERGQRARERRCGREGRNARAKKVRVKRIQILQRESARCAHHTRHNASTPGRFDRENTGLLLSLLRLAILSALNTHSAVIVISTFVGVVVINNNN